MLNKLCNESSTSYNLNLIPFPRAPPVSSIDEWRERTRSVRALNRSRFSARYIHGLTQLLRLLINVRMVNAAPVTTLWYKPRGCSHSKCRFAISRSAWLRKILVFFRNIWANQLGSQSVRQITYEEGRVRGIRVPSHPQQGCDEGAARRGIETNHGNHLFDRVDFRTWDNSPSA